MKRSENDAASFRVDRVEEFDPSTGHPGAAKLRDRLARAGVVALSLEAPLDEAGFERVAELFGPIKDPVAVAPDGQAIHYSERRQIIDSGFVLTDALREKLGDLQFGGLDDDRPGLFETFHCDDTFAREPARVTVLNARELPPSGGGATHFLDMRDALECLPSALRQQVAGLRVACAHNNGGVFPPRRAAEGPADVLAPVSHPLVRTHPQADTRALYLDLDRATHVEALPVGEGRELLQALQEHAEANAQRCQHTWRPHDVLVWDNASVQHKAGGDFPVGEPRRFWRSLVSAETPV